MSTKKEKEQKKTVEEQTEETINNSAESIEDITHELEITEESVDSEEVADELQEKYDLLEQKNQTLQNDYLRLMAEFDNYRRRAAKERLELISTASEDVIKSLLPILDDCERALEHLKSSDNADAAKEGTELIFNKLFNLLKSKGLAEIEAVGKDLDTDFQEAVAQFPVEDQDKKNKVIDVVQKGYTLNGKVIRFAKVVVGI